ncbi:MAG: peptidoglycan-binding protein [Minisyncoccota bacterium]
MKKIKNVIRLPSQMKMGMVLMLSAFMFAFAPFVADAATIARSLELGMSGTDVTSLQTFLATDSSVYPSGLVTGYFGELTKAGVERFQAKNGIVSSGTPATTGYGRVGPQTMSAINAQMGGTVVTSGINTAPAIGIVSTNVSNNSATVSWNTNENASAILYYSNSPIPMTEGSETRGVTIGGSSILVNSNLQTSHVTTISGLNSGTTYYYVAYVRDVNGNESVTWPATFQTSN